MSTPSLSHGPAGPVYQVQAVGTAGPMRLVVMLYDGALGSIARAARAMEEGGPGSIETSHFELTKAQDIISELMLTLDMELGGGIASSLAGLYDFWLTRLTRANLEKNPSLLHVVSSGLAELRDAWSHVMSMEASGD